MGELAPPLRECGVLIEDQGGRDLKVSRARQLGLTLQKCELATCRALLRPFLHRLGCRLPADHREKHTHQCLVRSERQDAGANARELCAKVGDGLK